MVVKLSNISTQRILLPLRQTDDMHNLFHKFVDFLDEANQVRLYVFRSLQRHCPWRRTNTVEDLDQPYMFFNQSMKFKMIDNIKSQDESL
jgi:hypothetical protein